MNAFIVISLNDSLSSIVEDIANRCLPQNPDVDTYISTGCIKRSDHGYTYHYTVYNHGVKESKEGRDLSDLLKNQAAAFRATHGIVGKMNVFVLHNPMTSEEYETDKGCIAKLEELNKTDTNLFFFHILFTYDLSCPSDVCKQMPKEIVEQCIGDRNEYSFRDNSRLMYFSNYTLVAAALCLNEEEHSLKLPRILSDFMMLASSDSSSYGVMQQITNVGGEDTRCFSLGYAECMYYHPDVERYFIHSCRRDMLSQMLTCNDETSTSTTAADDMEAMNVDKYPFGLRLRKQRLEKYSDFPFSDNIGLYPQYADKIIDDCLKKLKPLLEREREQEIEDYENSAELTAIKNRIAELKELLGDTDDSDNTLQGELSEKEMSLERKCAAFKPDCPEFIDRDTIFLECSDIDGKQKQAYLAEIANQYDLLVAFVKSRKFKIFLEKEEKDTTAPKKQETEGQTSNDKPSGCLLSWVKRIFRGNNTKPTPGEPPIEPPVSTSVEGEDNFSLVNQIARMQQIKKAYADFKKKVEEVEQECEKQKEYCDDYKLTDHLHNSILLIDKNLLRKKYAENSEILLDKAREAWRASNYKTFSMLMNSVDNVVRKECEKYRWLDWNNQFSFVKPVDDTMLVDMCNNMERKSAPFTNYQIIESIGDSDISYVLYSNRNDFNNEIANIKTQLIHGNEISAFSSTHIESKICMFQFLPLSDEMLQNLTTLRDPG